MPIQFPSSPTVNQEYTYEGKVWAWDGSSWVGVRQQTGILSSNIWAKQSLLIPKRGFGLNSGYNATTDQRRTQAGTIPMLKHNMERDLGEFANTLSAWTPAQITTALWLDAADTSTITIATGVSQWADKSGNGRHATQATSANQPTYISSGMNSLGLVDWDGSNDAMTISGGTTTTLHSELSSDNTYSMAWVVKPDTISSQPVLLYVPESTFKFLIEIKSDGGVYWGDIATNNIYRTYSGGSFFGANTGSFFTLIKTGSGAGTAHVAGTLKSIFGGSLNDTPSLGAAFILGQYPGLLYDGKMAEIIISNYSWDTSERQQVEGYLAHKWGLTSSLPNDHPYKSTAP